MSNPRLPRGAFARLGFVVAIAAVLFAPHLARAGGRGWQAPARGEAGIVASADVIAEASRWIGQGNVTGKPGAWCAWFASFVLTRTGHKPLPNGLASSALSYGRRVRDPRPGDLAVMNHHVTFFAGWDGERDFLGLGGNQGRRVRVSRFARRAVIAFVRPT
jgi:uncharacterized protein (TIGR02594 family)